MAKDDNLATISKSLPKIKSGKDMNNEIKCDLDVTSSEKNGNISSHWSKIRGMAKQRLFTKTGKTGTKDVSNCKETLDSSVNKERERENPKENPHWSKVRRMTQERLFTRQIAQQLIEKNQHEDLKTKKKTAKSQNDNKETTKKTERWSKIGQLTKAHFFSAAKAFGNIPKTPKAHQTEDKKQNQAWKSYRSEIIGGSARIKTPRDVKDDEAKYIKYIDIATGKQIIISSAQIIPRKRPGSANSDSSRSTFKDSKGRLITSFNVGEHSKFIKRINISERFDIPISELIHINTKKMTPFKYVHVFHKMLPPQLCKSYRPSSVPDVTRVNSPSTTHSSRSSDPPTSVRTDTMSSSAKSDPPTSVRTDPPSSARLETVNEVAVEKENP